MQEVTSPSVDKAPNIVWKPLPGSQTLVMSCPANIIFYHGTRGPGKTDAQLMRFRARVGQGYGRHWRGIIFDREYKNLDDLVSKSMRWFPEVREAGSTKGDARFLSSKSDYRWVWPTGEELLFRAIKRPQDYWGYHGQEFPFIGWNELTKYPTDELFDLLMSCNRSSFLPEDHPYWISGTAAERGVVKYVAETARDAVKQLPPELPLEVFATGNPFGAGHNWVKKRFVNAAPLGKIVRKTVTIFNPRTQKKEDISRSQVHIFGSYRENKYLSPEYVAELNLLTDKNKRAAWLGGSWDIVSGGMFDDVWDSTQHVIPPFEIPMNWAIDRSFDWGSSAPFSVGWWAVSDGSDVRMPDGTWRSTVRGDLFRIAEWYGTTGKPNQGLRMLANEVAAGIVEREIRMKIKNRVRPGPADNSIYDTENGNSIAVDMARSVKIDGSVYSGVHWTRSDKSPGSRKAGWEKLRLYLKQALRPTAVNAAGKVVTLPRERPGLFIFNTCTAFVDLFPILPRSEKDPDDVDTDAEDHIGDEARYRILSISLGGRVGRTTGT